MQKPTLKRRIISSIAGISVWVAVSLECSAILQSSDPLQDSVDDYSAGRVVFGVLIPVFFGMLLGGCVYDLIKSYRRRFPAGHCQRCGYDLTGNVSGVCPECGSEVKQP